MPKENQNMFVVLKGNVNVIASETVYNSFLQGIKKRRKKRHKEHRKKIRTIGENYMEFEKVKFETDFPDDESKSNDYKKLGVNDLFGNDKLITNKGFRPSFALSEGIITVVLVIPVAKIE
jgi:hypothetical protein